MRVNIAIRSEKQRLVSRGRAMKVKRTTRKELCPSCNGRGILKKTRWWSIVCAVAGFLAAGSCYLRIKESGAFLSWENLTTVWYLYVGLLLAGGFVGLFVDQIRVSEACAVCHGAGRIEQSVTEEVGESDEFEE